ncbi:odorant receptor Or2-like isoform X2 [Nomia melanderi]|uniref:odorant receptor Or2-like isoform X2 n=1 Tax=Nomia melanderi TaxID=2448451 RepID=UPI003FCE7520
MQITEQTDISVRLCALFMKLAGMWTAENDREQRIRDYTLIYSQLLNVIALCISVRDMYFRWKLHDMLMYSFCNFLSIITVTIKIFILPMYKVQLLDLLAYTRKHFWNGNYDEREKQIMADTSKYSILFVSFVILTAHGTMVCYVVAPLIENIGKNETERMLPFHFWIPYFQKSPIFEITFVLQVFNLYHTGVCYFCFDNFLCIMNMHAAGQFRILQYRLTKLSDTGKETPNQPASTNLTDYAKKSYAQLKKCVQHHQALINYCNQLENSFTIVLLGQVLIFSVLICLFGYEVFLAKDLSVTRRYVFIFLMVGSSYLLFMFTYSCNGLLEQSQGIHYAAFSAPWNLIPMTQTGKTLRRTLLFVILRSEKVCALTACGFFPISLDTYRTIMSTAVSYFTLLKQSLDDSDDI